MNQTVTKGLKTVVSFLPVIINAIKMVEKMTDKETPGEIKKVLAVDIVNQTFSNFGIDLDRRMLEFAKETIDYFVDVFNAFGWDKQIKDSLELELDTPLSSYPSPGS